MTTALPSAVGFLADAFTRLQTVAAVASSVGLATVAILIAASAVRWGMAEGRLQRAPLRKLNGWFVPLCVSVAAGAVTNYAVARVAFNPVVTGLIPGLLAAVPTHAALIAGPATAVIAIVIFVHQRRAGDRFVVAIGGALAVIVAHVLSWVLLGFATSLGRWAENVYFRGTDGVAAGAVDYRAPIAMAAWMWTERQVTRYSYRAVRGVTVGDSFNGDSAWRTVTAVGAEMARSDMLDGYHVTYRRGKHLVPYVLLSSVAAIVVAARTGGDAHAAAMTKAQVEAALVLCHHAGRVIAHLTAPAPS